MSWRRGANCLNILSKLLRLRRRHAYQVVLFRSWEKSISKKVSEVCLLGYFQDARELPLLVQLWSRATRWENCTSTDNLHCLHESTSILKFVFVNNAVVFLNYSVIISFDWTCVGCLNTPIYFLFIRESTACANNGWIGVEWRTEGWRPNISIISWWMVFALSLFC